MKLLKSLTYTSVLATALFSASSFAATPIHTNGLVGTWHNVNPSSRGTIKVVVTKVGGHLKFKSYGSCHPTPCVHSTVAAQPYSRNVSANHAVGFTAFRNSGFKTTRYDAMRDYGQSSGAFLRLNAFNKYAAGDSRKNYASSDLFVKR